MNNIFDKFIDAQEIMSGVAEVNVIPPDFPVIDTRDYYLADWKYEKIREQVEEFQSDLSEDLDVCAKLTAFGQSTLMFVDDIGYQNPDMLYFYGTINGQKAQLIQHASQLNFLLMAVPKAKPEDKPKRIGFIIEEE